MEEAMCETHVLRLSELKANMPIPEFRFHVQLPLGTIVYEMGQGRLIGHTQATLKHFEREPTVGQYDETYRHALRGDEFDGAQ